MVPDTHLNPIPQKITPWVYYNNITAGTDSIMPYNVYWQSFSNLILFIISSISIASCPTENLKLSLLLEMMYTVSTAFWGRTLNVHIKFKQKCEGNYFSIFQGPCWFSRQIRWWWQFCREFLIGGWSVGNLWEWERKEEYGLGNSAYVSGQVIKSKQHHIYTFALDWNLNIHI